jgi:transcriptional regulator with XRE-family HTH domain
LLARALTQIHSQAAWNTPLGLAGEDEMKALHLPYRKRFIRDDSSWGLVGTDSDGARGSHITFMPVDLVPIRMRLVRARKHLSQADVAKKLGLTRQAYTKLERPGANLQLRTIQLVEGALDAELLQLASSRGLRAKLTAKPTDNHGRRRTSAELRLSKSNLRGRRPTSMDSAPST